MSEISDAIQAKCLAFGDRVIKLNDYLLAQAVAAHQDYKKLKSQKNGKQTSSFLHQTSDISIAAVPVYLQSVSNLCNQLLRAGTSIGANNAEATNAISKADFKSKSFIALKEARESLYWIELLHRNNYIDNKQYHSMSKVKKAIWLSYDLGIGGDYPGLYKWLDNHKAFECGNSVAFFEYLVEKGQLDDLLLLLKDDIDSAVDLRSGDRLYVVYRKSDGSKCSVNGNFIYGRRKSNPWEGYGDSEPQGGEDGE